MEVYWLEQTEADVPEENDWLSAGEAKRMDGLRFAKRRADWRLGRWTAKRALAVCLNLPPHPGVLARIEIRPATSGAPEVFVTGKSELLTVSLSHRAGRAACAVTQSSVDLGCDLEIVEPHSDAFVADYFTVEEQALAKWAPAADRPRLLALLWSAKESALKALHEGLRLDTRSVTVRLVEAFDLFSWSRLQVRCTDGRIFHGWWRHTDGMVRTLVADPPPDAPIRLNVPAYFPDRASRCA